VVVMEEVVVGGFPGAWRSEEVRCGRCVKRCAQKSWSIQVVEWRGGGVEKKWRRASPQLLLNPDTQSPHITSHHITPRVLASGPSPPKEKKKKKKKEKWCPPSLPPSHQDV